MTDSESRKTEPADGTADSERNRLSVGTAVLLVIVQLVVFGFLTFVSKAVQLLDPLNLAPTSDRPATLMGLATVWAVASWVLWAARRNLIAALVSIAPLVVVFVPLAGIFSSDGSLMGDPSAEGAYVVTETYDSGKKKVVEEWRDEDLVRRHHYWETGKRQSVETYGYIDMAYIKEDYDQDGQRPRGAHVVYKDGTLLEERWHENSRIAERVRQDQQGVGYRITYDEQGNVLGCDRHDDMPTDWVEQFERYCR